MVYDLMLDKVATRPRLGTRAKHTVLARNLITRQLSFDFNVRRDFRPVVSVVILVKDFFSFAAVSQQYATVKYRVHIDR